MSGWKNLAATRILTLGIDWPLRDALGYQWLLIFWVTGDAVIEARLAKPHVPLGTKQ